jgi:transcriptional regulator with XRE-family HTH domain
MNKIDPVENFKRNLYRLRKERGLSQRSLASKMGVTQRLITYYEKDAPNIPLTQVQKFADALGVSVVELLDPRPRIGSGTEELDVRTIRKIKEMQNLPRRTREALWQNINHILELHRTKEKKKSKE